MKFTQRGGINKIQHFSASNVDCFPANVTLPLVFVSRELIMAFARIPVQTCTTVAHRVQRGTTIRTFFVFFFSEFEIELGNPNIRMT